MHHGMGDDIIPVWVTTSFAYQVGVGPLTPWLCSHAFPARQPALSHGQHCSCILKGW